MVSVSEELNSWTCGVMRAMSGATRCTCNATSVNLGIDVLQAT